MPVRLLVAARTKTTRFRRLYRKPVNESTFVSSFRSVSHDLEDQDSEDQGSNLTERVGETPSTSEETNGRNAEQHQYSTVRQVFQSETTGEEIRSDEMVKGYEIAPNEFAAIQPQEIKAAEIETSDTIDLFHFVKAEEVDPIYFERSYYVAPDSGAEKSYALLLEAMRKEECLGIARIGMHRREHMLILRPSEDYLVAYTMFYANELRSTRLTSNSWRIFVPGMSTTDPPSTSELLVTWPEDVQAARGDVGQPVATPQAIARSWLPLLFMTAVAAFRITFSTKSG